MGRESDRVHDLDTKTELERLRELLGPEYSVHVRPKSEEVVVEHAARGRRYILFLNSLRYGFAVRHVEEARRWCEGAEE